MLHHSLIRALFVMGRKAPAIGYLETSADLVSATIAVDILDCACRSNDPASVRAYLAGVASTLIAEGC